MVWVLRLLFWRSWFFNTVKLLPLFLLLIFAKTLHSQQLGHGYEFENNGKRDRNEKFEQIYTKVEIDAPGIGIDFILKKALKQNEKFLKRKASEHSIGNLDFSNSELLGVSQKLHESLDSIDLSSFEFHQINGEDEKGNVHFTGYFVPVIEVHQQADSVFKYPLYERPSIPYSQMPSRKEIDFDKALKGQNLELAYTSSLLDNFFMQVQGSGIIRYQDGKTKLLSYGGNNGKKYTSIGKYLVSSGQIEESEISLKSIREYFEKNPDSLETVLSKNESYTFFVKTGEKPVGAANIALTPEVSIAVDPNFIPLSSILLAKVPTLNEAGELVGHEFQIVIAQDKGGAIRGSGHVDVYFGIGNDAKKKASALHHYGVLWLLLPKEN